MDADIRRRLSTGKSAGPEIVTEPFELIDFPQMLLGLVLFLPQAIYWAFPESIDTEPDIW